MIHQLLPSFFSGDAIGNQANLIRSTLRSMGLKSSQVYAQYRDARLGDAGKDYHSFHLGSHDWVIYHHSIDSPVAPLALQYVDRMVFYYHNITPGEFLRRYDQRLAKLLDRGRTMLPEFRQAPLVFTVSAYNASELRAAGFRDPVVIPLLVDAETLIRSAQTDNGKAVQNRMAGGAEVKPINWLFVGRLAPNKRQDILIRAFHYYHRFVQPESKLYLVGSDMFSPGYRLELEALIATLNLQRKVILAGAPTMTDGFGGYFAGATIFVCASEHEGFCVPLVEAMAFGLPVVAYKCTGVPEAIGRGGMLLDDNAPAALAEAADLLLTDTALRQQFASEQQAQVMLHTPEVVSEVLRSQLETLATRSN